MTRRSRSASGAAAHARVLGEVRQLLRDAGTPGATIALSVDGRPVLAEGIGSASLDGAVPLDRDALFYTYSITKTLTAIAVLQAVARQAICLDQLLQHYLPELDLETPVTVRQVLNHTAGLPDYGGLTAYKKDVRARPYRPWTGAEFLERTRFRALRFEPGRGWAYSNIGYLVLRLMLERLHGGSFAEVLRSAIFEPLGLGRSFVAETLADTRELTPGFSEMFGDEGRLGDVSGVYHPGWVSHGVVVSTASEIRQLFDALVDGRLVDRDLLPEMLEPVMVPGRHPLFRRPAYGLGLMIDAESPHGTLAGHAGEGPGYSTAALHFSDLAGHAVTSVALANRDVDDLGLRIAIAAAGCLLQVSD